MKFRTICIGLALATLLTPKPASATVTVQGWWHFDAVGLPVDSSGNGRNYRGGFIVPIIYQQGSPPTNGPGAGALVSSEAAGGPLGTSGYTSTHSLRLGLEGDSDTFWQVGTNAADSYVPPPTNYIVEIWVKPQGSTNNNNLGGYWRDSQNEVWIFSSGGFDCIGSGPAFGWGGACVRVKHENGTVTPYIQAGYEIQPDSHFVNDFGPHLPVDTNAWMHMALVNTNGILSFWTNGALCAVCDSTPTPPAGAMHLGTDGAWNGFNGYIDEERVLTFDEGDFSPSLFLYTPTPRIVQQPQNITVWSNGAAMFQVDVSQDPCTEYKWYLFGTNPVAGANGPDLYLNPVAPTNQVYNCLLTNACTSGIGLSSSNATLTVVAPNMGNVNVYRDAVNAEATLVAYYPVDGNAGATLTDTKNGNNGALQGGADYDGQTNRSFGERAVFIKHGNGDVQIAHRDAYEFGPGGGTVEALVYLMNSMTPEPGACATLFSVAKADGSKARYQLAATSDGSSLVYANDAGERLSWAVPVSLLNRFAHVAFVFTANTHVTAYADGKSLGTKAQTGFGSSDATDNGWIGWGPALGSPMTNNVPAYWYGTIDELAIYTSSLAYTNIAIHNWYFIHGTNPVVPSIVSQTTGPRTLYTGGSPVLWLEAEGSPPLSYQWYSNAVAIAGATSPSLTLANATTAYTATDPGYSCTVTNDYGSASTTPIALTFVNPPTNNPTVVAVMADHPTAFWRLNELAPSTAADCAGGNDGTYNASGVTYGVAGPPSDPETAVRFDGTAGRVTVPYTSVLNPTGPFTIEFWAQLNRYGFCSPISSMVRPAESGGYEFNLAFNYAGYEFHTAAGGGLNMMTGDGSRPPVGAWAHVAGVWDGTTMSLYVNGYPANPDFTNSNPPFTANASTPFYIGSRSDSVGYFNGAMSGVAFYNYALTSIQISNHLSVGMPLKLALTVSTNVIADSNPANPPLDGLNNGAKWVQYPAGGRVGAMQFSPSATNDHEISVFGYPRLANTNGAIMFWMRTGPGLVPSGGNQNQAACLFLWRMPGVDGGGMFIGVRQDGSIMAQGGVSHPSCDSGSVTVTNYAWHHVALTFDQSSAATPSITLYIDGTQVGAAISTVNWVWPNQNFLIQIGADMAGYDAWWNDYSGMLDDFRIYDKLLDATEVGTAKGGGLLTTNLILRYNFDTAPNGYVVTWPYGDLLVATNVAGPYSWPGGLTNTPPYSTRSPFPVPKSTVDRLRQQFFRAVR